MWGGVGNPKIRPRPIAPIRHPVTRTLRLDASAANVRCAGRMLNVKEWLSSMKSSKPDPSIPQCVPRLALRHAATHPAMPDT